MATLLLASASPARAALLRAAGVEPMVFAADLDEEALLATEARRRGRSLPAADAVALLAKAKAEAVAGAPVMPATVPDSDRRADLVLGCDSLLEFEGATFGKPLVPQLAAERWRRMRGRSGVLHTGHWLIAAAGGCGSVISTTVHFAELSDAEIDAYVATGEPLNVAGAFTIDGRGGAFVRRVEGDHHAVIGLSLASVRDLAARLGVRWVDLWR